MPKKSCPIFMVYYLYENEQDFLDIWYIEYEFEPNFLPSNITEFSNIVAIQHILQAQENVYMEVVSTFTG